MEVQRLVVESGVGEVSMGRKKYCVDMFPDRVVRVYLYGSRWRICDECGG